MSGTPVAALPVPAGFTPDNESWDGKNRVLWATPRGISTSTDVLVSGVAIQLADGTIAAEWPEPPGAYIEGCGNSALTTDGLRELAQVLTELADELDALTVCRPKWDSI